MKMTANSEEPVLPRAAKIKCIENNARLLRPTKSTIASRRSPYKRKDKQTHTKTNSKKPNRRLTIPKSPNFHHRPKRELGKKSLLSMTSKELMEISALRKRVEIQKKKCQRYHQATMGATNKDGVQSKTKGTFSQTVRACGSIGIPAIRRTKLTVPVEFELSIDKRLAKRQKKIDDSVIVQGKQIKPKLPRIKEKKDNVSTDS